MRNTSPGALRGRQGGLARFRVAQGRRGRGALGTWSLRGRGHWRDPPASSAPSSPASPQARAGPHPSRAATKAAASSMPDSLRAGRPRARPPPPPEPARCPVAPGDRKRPSLSRFMVAAPALRPAPLGPEFSAARRGCARSLPPAGARGRRRGPGHRRQGRRARRGRDSREGRGGVILRPGVADSRAI